MNKLLRYFTIVFLILFEIYAGVRLLTDPVDFTNSVIVFFGIVMLIIGIVSVVDAFRIKSRNLPYSMTLWGGILDLVIGAVCVALSANLIDLLPELVVIYGIIMIISSIHKIRLYAFFKDLQVKHAWIFLVSAILGILLGILVLLHPVVAIAVAWDYTGWFLIFSGVFDLFAFIFSFFF